MLWAFFVSGNDEGGDSPGQRRVRPLVVGGSVDPPGLAQSTLGTHASEAGKAPTLTGEPRQDWALWLLSQVMRSIVSREDAVTGDDMLAEVAA